MPSTKHGFPFGNKHVSHLKQRLFIHLAIPLLIGAGLLVFLLPAYGDQQLLQRTLSLTDATPGQAVTYKFGFTFTASETLGSMRLQFCANDPIIDTPCTAPDGFDVSAAALATQSGETGFSISPISTANVLVLTRTPAAAGAGAASYTLNNVTNPTAAGSYYVRVQTYTADDATGTANDYGGLAFSISERINISAEVPPYLLFCTGVTISGLDCSTASGDYLNFGNLSAGKSSSSQSQMLVATNADNGYGITVNGSTLTSGNNVITALTSSDVSRPGTSQFGINLRANSDPAVGAEVVGPGSGSPLAPYNVPDRYVFHSGDVVAQTTGVEDYRKYTVSYLINISKDQAPGVYVSTMSYVAGANF